MRGTWSKRVLLLFALLSALILSPLARATNVTVDCNAKKNNSINAALATLSKQGPHTITVSGTCNEAVVIENFDNLTLTGNPGASINDPTPFVTDDNDVIDISRSRNVTVQGFTVNGGFNGVSCFDYSVCYLQGLTVQSAADTGVVFNRASGFVFDAVIQNNNFRGVSLGSSVVGFTGSTIQNNGTAVDGGVGVTAIFNSNLALFSTTIQNHPYGDGAGVDRGTLLRLVNSTITASGGTGVSVRDGSQLSVNNSSITGSGGDGVSADGNSVVRLGAPTITGNAGNGVSLGHLSFLRIDDTRNISGNGAPDVNCAVSTAKTVGTGGSVTPDLGGGTTNCTEPAP